MFSHQQNMNHQAFNRIFGHGEFSLYPNFYYVNVEKYVIELATYVIIIWTEIIFALSLSLSYTISV